jgi:Tfp pilus assembly protein PilO
MKMSPRERNIVMVVGAVIVLFLADRYAWSPYMAAREQSQADLAAARDKQIKAQHLLKEDRTNRQTFDKMIADGLQTDPSAAESQMLHAVDDWARDAHVNLQTVKRERMEQDKQFGRIVFRATAMGNMASLARFLWDVQTTKLPARVVDLQIALRQGAKEGTDDLSMTVAVSTLVRGQVPASGPSTPVAMASAPASREGR